MKYGDVVLGVVTDLSQLIHHLGFVVGVPDPVALQDEPTAHDTLLASAVLPKKNSQNHPNIKLIRCLSHCLPKQKNRMV